MRLVRSHNQNHGSTRFDPAEHVHLEAAIELHVIDVVEYARGVWLASSQQLAAAPVAILPRSCRRIICCPDLVCNPSSEVRDPNIIRSPHQVNHFSLIWSIADIHSRNSSPNFLDYSLTRVFWIPPRSYFCMISPVLQTAHTSRCTKAIIWIYTMIPSLNNTNHVEAWCNQSDYFLQ